MIDAILLALSNLLAMEHLVFLVLGVVVGLVTGVIPGLGGVPGLALLLPLLYGMDPISAFAMMIGVVAAIPTADTFASVLMGIPGSSASQATVLDGFPLAKDGQAARALSAAFISSLYGGLIGALVLTGFILIARPILLAFGTAELLAFSLFGLTMVAALSGNNLLKGLAACCIGLILGSIGAAPATGDFRMTFNTDYLYDGIPLVVAALGIFAIPEIVDLLRQDQSIAGKRTLGSGWLTGLKDWSKNLFLSTRCAGIGALIGATPGLGGTVVDWVAYGHTVQSAKAPTHFGRGDIRGVIGPESANNAMQGGTFLPTVLFGIPGSGSMAVFLGALVILGIQPGPAMATTDIDISYTIIWSLTLANVIGAGLCLALAIPISKLTQVSFQILAPFMIVLICFAAFQATRDMSDLYTLLVIGVLGVLMKRFGWSRPALLIGFVLAPQIETYFYQTLQFYDWSVLLRPGVIVIAILCVLSLFFGLKNRKESSESSQRYRSDPEAQGEAKDQLIAQSAAPIIPQLSFVALAALLFLYAILDARQWSNLSALFPLVTSALGIGFLSLLMLQITGVKILTRGQRKAISSGEESILRALSVGTTAGSITIHEPSDPIVQGSVWAGLAWIAGLIFLSTLIGFFLAMIVFVVGFLVFRAKASPLQALGMTGGMAAFLATIAQMISLNFPAGLLQEKVDLPWPMI